MRLVGVLVFVDQQITILLLQARSDLGILLQQLYCANKQIIKIKRPGGFEFAFVQFVDLRNLLIIGAISSRGECVHADHLRLGVADSIEHGRGCQFLAINLQFGQTALDGAKRVVLVVYRIVVRKSKAFAVKTQQQRGKGMKG